MDQAPERNATSQSDGTGRRTMRRPRSTRLSLTQLARVSDIDSTPDVGMTTPPRG